MMKQSVRYGSMDPPSAAMISIPCPSIQIWDANRAPAWTRRSLVSTPESTSIRWGWPQSTSALDSAHSTPVQSSLLRQYSQRGAVADCPGHSSSWKVKFATKTKKQGWCVSTDEIMIDNCALRCTHHRGFESLRIGRRHHHWWWNFGRGSHHLPLGQLVHFYSITPWNGCHQR